MQRLRSSQCHTVPSVSTSRATFRASEVAMSVLAAVTARMMQLGLEICFRISSLIWSSMSLGWSPTGTYRPQSHTVHYYILTYRPQSHTVHYYILTYRPQSHTVHYYVLTYRPQSHTVHYYILKNRQNSHSPSSQQVVRACYFSYVCAMKYRLGLTRWIRQKQM